MAGPKPEETQILIMKDDREKLKELAKVEGRTMKGMFTKLVDDAYKKMKNA